MRDTHCYVLVRYDNYLSWWELVGDKLTSDGRNGYTPDWSDGSHEILDTVWGDKNIYERLDWTRTSLCLTEGDAGWLDRSGRWYPCYYGTHDRYARLVLEREVSDLENCGWVRVLEKASFQPRGWMMGARAGLRLSPEQRNWLLGRGYLVHEED